ncbi:hypothetical protein K466DRAFT_168886 [Polyporus arcularius HHB13444]|uniref:Uncharacterized protein n=1 Tax=Polyporus arcularius HHB13444 TaxID=1314778 RepID=A0A5C3PWC5_9APHY|nr:hypothetical protein K466DRAFT_168886 [Polyporus arcularius HHB13444]
MTSQSSSTSSPVSYVQFVSAIASCVLCSGDAQKFGCPLRCSRGLSFLLSGNPLHSRLNLPSPLNLLSQQVAQPRAGGTT